MEEVQRMGDCGETIVIEREWEMTDEAVKWLVRERNYVQLREERGSGAMSSHLDDADAGEYVLLVQVQRDYESVKKACLTRKEQIVVARSLVEGGGACHELLHSSSYLECLSTDQTDDDLRYYYRAEECILKLDSVTDPLLCPAEGHCGTGECDDWESCLSNVMETCNLADHEGDGYSTCAAGKGDDSSDDKDEYIILTCAAGASDAWGSCRSNVMDTSTLADHEQLRVTGTADDGAAVMQTPTIRWVVDALARTDEFHLDLKLKVKSLVVGVSNREFKATDTCLGFYPDKICLSLKPSWAEMSEAIFEDVPSTNMGKNSCTTTQTTTIGMGIHCGLVDLSASHEKGKAQTGPDVSDELHRIDYQTEQRGVASFVWRICKWADGKHYKSDHNLPFSHSWFLKKQLPKLPFRGAYPSLKDLAAATWRLPITMMHQDLSFNLHLCFQMRFIAMKGKDTFQFFSSLDHKKVLLERDFKFKIQLPATLTTSSATSTPSN